MNGKVQVSSPDRMRERIVESSGLIKQTKQKDAMHLFSPHCIQHNPYVIGGVRELFDSLSAVQKDTGPKSRMQSFLLGMC